jgi:hypothetical protein
MTSKWLLLSLYFFHIFHQINSRISSLQCWKCEITIESLKEPGVFLDSMLFLLLIDFYISKKYDFRLSPSI